MHILIAEDEPIIRLGLRSMLEELGHSVTMALNGREALQMIRRQSFDLAMLDIKMPYTNGLEAAKKIQETNPMPIIMISAFSEQDLVDKASNLTIQGYLVKPLLKEQLAAAIIIAYKRFSDLQASWKKAEELSNRLAHRKLIDRAKGKLMDKGMSEEQAYQALLTQARQLRRPVFEIAGLIIKSSTE